MKKYIIIGVLVAVGIGFVSLLAVDIPAPTKHVEREIPDDELPN